MGRGKIPPTEKLILESEESQWRMLVRGLINELRTTALIERSPEQTVRVHLVIESIIPPEHNRETNRCNVESNMEKKISSGLARTKEFTNDWLSKSMWMFVGYIEGEGRTPILITYYECIKTFFYTQKLVDESHNTFSPFPSLN